MVKLLIQIAMGMILAHQKIENKIVDLLLSLDFKV